MKANNFPRLHYVSQEIGGLSHLDAIEKACKAGCKWVQLRVKDVDFDTYCHTAIKAKALCDKYGTILTINDNPLIAKIAEAGGLHLGKEDMSPSDARQIVGDIIVGGTANSWEDIVRLSKEPIDYIGLGPFRFTKTKKKLSPVLGVEGYKMLLDKMIAHNIQIPVLAIGGIQLEDVSTIMETGVYGIAFSGMLTHAENPKELYTTLEQLL